MQVLNYEYNPFLEITDQEKFISILHHDSRGGFAKIMKFYPNKKPYGYASKVYNELIVKDKKCDAYITLNTFNKPSKNTKNLYSINCIYFDLDLHISNQEQIDFCIENTLKILEKEFEAGELPVPTIITNSGRGLGLYYVLNNSIPNVSSSKKTIEYWKLVYNALYDSIERVLSLQNDVLELDSTSKADASRIVRLPGTVNTNNGKECVIEKINCDMYGNVQYHTLRKLATYVKDYIDAHNKEKQLKRESAKIYSNKKIINFTTYKMPFLYTNMKRLEMLQANFNSACTDKRRELMCFYYYNSIKQLDSVNASKKLIVFNEGFAVPLDLSELNHVMESVDNNKAQYGNYAGYYRISNKTMEERLNLTEDEKSVCGFSNGCFAKDLRRKESKENNKKIKEQRDKEVIELVTMHPEMTYEEISDRVGFSLRTIKNILKKNNIRRYNKNSDDVEKITDSKYENDTSVTEDKEIYEDNSNKDSDNIPDNKINAKELMDEKKNEKFFVMSKKCKNLPASLKSSSIYDDIKGNNITEQDGIMNNIANKGDNEKLGEDDTGQLYFTDVFKKSWYYLIS